MDTFDSGFPFRISHEYVQSHALINESNVFSHVLSVTRSFLVRLPIKSAKWRLRNTQHNQVPNTIWQLCHSATVLIEFVRTCFWKWGHSIGSHGILASYQRKYFLSWGVCISTVLFLDSLPCCIPTTNAWWLCRECIVDAHTPSVDSARTSSLAWLSSTLNTWFYDKG